MPTEPYDNILPRNIENLELTRTLSSFSDLIEETVNYSTHVFMWCFETERGHDENVPIFMSYRHILELLDAISILMRQSCIDPCKVLLRAVFESTLSIEYILENNTIQRGMDFMVCYYHNELKHYRRWDPDDPMYAEFQSKLRSDKILGNWDSSEIPDVKDEIDKRNRILELPRYRESEAEYQNLRRQGTRNPKWYSLHSGPSSIEKLAERLDRSGMYHILYRHWSTSVHGTDLIRGKISIDDEKRVNVHQIRLPTNAEEVTKFSVSFALLNINTFTDHFCSHKKNENAQWYKDNIQTQYLELVEKKIIIVE